MKIVVIGGTGFIGKHLCQKISNIGLTAVTVSRHPDIRFLENYAPSVAGFTVDSVSAWNALSEANTVVYLGSSTKPGSDWRSPSSEIEVSVTAFADFMRRLLDCNPACHIIYASSGGAIYGSMYTSPVHEGIEPLPVTAYALGKLITEKTLGFFHRVDGNRVTILRISNPVGRWQSGGRHGLVSAAIEACLSSRELFIFGEGNNVRDYFDVDELADLIIKIALNPDAGARFEVYNVGSGTGFTEKEIVDAVQYSLHRIINIKFSPARAFDIKYSVLDSEKVFRDYGWRSVLSPYEIIAKMARCRVE